MNLPNRVGSSPLARGLHDHALALLGVHGIIPARAGFTEVGAFDIAAGEDHPRSRGVYLRGGECRHCFAGSSPLARGLRGPQVGVPVRARIIPARAGFTCEGESVAIALPDHPRSRGVYEGRKWEFPYGHGSSPLARGLLPRQVVRHERPGIIPARAGFTRSVRPRRTGRRDHPRSRGVYPFNLPVKSLIEGSSPLARGLRRHRHPAVRPGGIIPARAGFTRDRAGRPGPGPDHPRSRGVYPPTARHTPRTTGSSPLARGLRLLTAAGTTALGIIPARAGFTGSLLVRGMGDPDHPRSRGVYADTVRLAMSTHGSSPLARGLRPAPRTRPLGNPDHPRSRGVYGDGRHSGCRATGIIPARAGFTASTCPDAPDASDHPRSRGVYRTYGRVTKNTDGSSPLARGLRGRGDVVHAGGGIIPARAGFTLRETVTAQSRAGSSPLARGLRSQRSSIVAGLRIIPARAGFTSRRRQRRARRWDHPRSRGVYCACRRPGAAIRGSSPLARGLHLREQLHSVGHGIIPARAGFTCPVCHVGRVVAGIIPARAGFTRGPCPSPVRGRDHPRSRGVYPAGRIPNQYNVGSSPLARGLRWLVPPGRLHARIIPARAGFTGTRGTRATRSEDHPRSRGVYLRLRRVRRGPRGSSPLARGLRRRESHRVTSLRIIPARAGFTSPSPLSWSAVRDHPRSRGVYSSRSPL